MLLNLGNNKYFVFLSFLFISACYQNNCKINCDKINGIEAYIAFSGFTNNELKNIKLIQDAIYKKDSITLTIDTLSIDTTFLYESNNDTLIKSIKLNVNECVFFEKNKDYFIVLDNPIKKISFKINSLKKHYMNTMFSEDCKCDINSYTVENYYHTGDEILIDKTQVIKKDN